MQNAYTTRTAAQANGATSGYYPFYYAMGWNQFLFREAAPAGDPETMPITQSHAGTDPNYRAIFGGSWPTFHHIGCN